MLVSALMIMAAGLKIKSWPVKLQDTCGREHVLQVRETQSVLSAIEAAGLLPGSDCRRGRCLSCAARVTGGQPFSLQVASDTALCELAHSRPHNLVLLCSAFVCGPGVELELGCEGEAWEVQHSIRWQSDAPLPQPLPLGEAPVHYRMPEDCATFLERCRISDLEAAAAADPAANSQSAYRPRPERLPDSSGEAGAGGDK